MQDFFSEIYAGDKIFIEPVDDDSCAGEYVMVTETKTEYDENTGESYKVICCDDIHFDARSGMALDPLSSYFITIDE